MNVIFFGKGKVYNRSGKSYFNPYLRIVWKEREKQWKNIQIWNR